MAEAEGSSPEMRASGRQELNFEVESPHPSERLLAFFEVLIVALLGDLLVVPLILSLGDFQPEQVFQEAGLLCLILVTKATATLLVIALLLKARGESYRVLGWRGSGFLKATWRGLAFLPVLFVAIVAVDWLFQLVLPQYVSETNLLLEMLQAPQDVLFFLATGVYVGGIQEEIQRAFVLTRFQRYLGGSLLGLILWSLFFGLGHAIQGVDNAVKAGVLGLLFGVLYLRGKNVTAPIVSHAFYDVITVLLFWFYMRS